MLNAIVKTDTPPKILGLTGDRLRNSPITINIKGVCIC